MSRRSGRPKSYSNIAILSSEYADDDQFEGENENIEEEQEVTRCVCGQDEVNTSLINHQLAELLLTEYQIKIDHGLFIQCDKCSVWQHGYCVGLYIGEDVPDKYWCELCKPDLHIVIHDDNDSVRTLYRPANDKRKRLLLEHSQSEQNNKSGRQRSRRNQQSLPSSVDSKTGRKERRHYTDDYDEQLQKAIRESARESGIDIQSDNNKRSNRKRHKQEEPQGVTKKANKEGHQVSIEKKDAQSSFNEDDDDVDEEEEDHEETERETSNKAKQEIKKPKIKSKIQKSKSKSRTSHPSPKNHPNGAPLTKDELTNQPSKPRYISDKSSIYELRKRIGAILEWLGRSQLELEEEKLNKIELFNYSDNNDSDDRTINEQNGIVIRNFNENLKAMEVLTEKIMTWEQRFGKYAP